MAEAHLTHLVEVLIATIASHLATRLQISLPSLWLVFSLTNSGGESLLLLLLLLRLLIISITILFIILLLVSGVHLRWSASNGRRRSGLLVVNLVN